MCSATTEALRSMRVEDGGSYLGNWAVLGNGCSDGTIHCIFPTVLPLAVLPCSISRPRVTDWRYRRWV